MSNDGKLIRMANQIADYYKAYSHEEAVEGVGKHIKSFWTRKMCAELIARIEASDPSIHALVVDAAGRFRPVDNAAKVG